MSAVAKKDFASVAEAAEYVDVVEARHMVAGDSNDRFSDAIVNFLGRIKSYKPVDV